MTARSAELPAGLEWDLVDLTRVMVRLRTRHGRRTVAVACAHGRTILGEPDVGLAADSAAALILAARDEHERSTACECLPRLADALDPDR